MEQVDNDPRTFAIIGAAMEVHRTICPGFSEPVCQEALEIELLERQIPYEREKELTVQYKGHLLSKTFRADFICYGEVIVETKALSNLCGVERSQVLNYLKASGLHVGLLLNFGGKKLEYERIVL